MIQCRKIGLSKGKKTILRDVDFQAAPGEITVLLGKNGSGKTSLLRCISGAYSRFQGEILLNGKNLSGLSPTERARWLAVLPQTLPQPPVTVEELTAFGRQPYTGYTGRLSQGEKEKVRRAMERSGVLPHAGDLVCNLSGGERQMAFFTMLLAQDTPAVLLDEPTANLDAEYRQRVFGFLRSMREEGKIIVTTLHSLEDAVQLGDRFWVMQEGAMVFSGTAGDFISSGLPERNFGLRPVQVSSPEEGDFTVFRPV